jgi:hypothetical protein
MSGIGQNVVFVATRLRVSFIRKGETKKYFGTAFWFAERAHTPASLVTNRHVVDPEYRFGPDSGFRLHAIEVMLRQYNGDVPTQNTEYGIVANLDSVKVHPTADLALIESSDCENWPFENLGAKCIVVGQLATDSWVIQNLQITHSASFVGFAMESKLMMWDTLWSFPIARTCVISSPPGMSFSNPAISTSHAVLVSGFSFSGSSGSIVISHERGSRLPPHGTVLDHGSAHVEPKVLGIMSGHLVNRDPTQLGHLGLSYYTKISALFEILDGTVDALAVRHS